MRDKKKIIILISSLFYTNDFKRYGVEKYLSNGYDIEICNTCPIVYPDFFRKVEKINTYKRKLEKFFFKKQELRDYLNLNKKNLFILIIHYNTKTHFIFRLISKFNINYMFSIVNIVPSNIEVNKKIIFKKYFDFRALLETFNNRISGFLKRNFQKINPPSYLIAGGLKSLESPQASIIKNSTKIIWTHTFDFDEYLSNLKKKDYKINEFPKDFAVFIDAPSPLIKHDALIPGISSPLTAKVYFPSLCRFFDKIEKELNLEVIIAAHPKSNHSQRPEYFGNRSVFNGMTIDLIKKSKLVINRNSTAINFAILHSKPIIFHTSKEILSHFVMTNQINSMANLLNKKPINIDTSINLNLKDELNINKDLYINYVNQYIKNPNSKNDYSWNIIMNELRYEK